MKTPTTMTSDGDDAASLDIALRELPEDIKITLALLHPASNEMAALTLAALPLGSRVMLAGFRIIDKAGTDKADDPARASLTDFGREVISTCAREGLPTEINERLNALAEARRCVDLLVRLRLHRKGRNREGACAHHLHLEALARPRDRRASRPA